ncbi:MAG: hypothetical protein JSS02_25590, partial [Planctomycetes bacterium]|nr:hypothetical protein [Planctomycetota bacterium]
IDHYGTLFDDSVKDRTFTYLELFNVSPYPVRVDSQNWQILLLDPQNPITSQSGPLFPKTTQAVSVLTFNDYTTATVSAGQPYTIASRVVTDGKINERNANNSFHGSAFVVDTTWDPTMNPTSNPNFANKTDLALKPYAVIPANGGTINLDLVASAYSGATGGPSDSNQPFILTQGNLITPNTTVGDFCDLTLQNGSSAGSHNYGTDAQSGLWNTPATLRFSLRRRLNLDRPAPRILTDANYSADDDDNPYIEVDRMSYSTKYVDAGTVQTQVDTSGYYFAPSDPSGLSAAQVATDLNKKLPLLNSRERTQPLDGDEGAKDQASNADLWDSFSPLTAYPGLFATGGGSGLPTNNRVPYYYSVMETKPNTIGAQNYVTMNDRTDSTANVIAAPKGFTIWQPHFDRDFASVMELMSVPLYAPNFVTHGQILSPNVNGQRYKVISEYPLPVQAGKQYLPLVAQAKILRPQHPANVNNTPPTYQYDNRWYRVFELLEVPPVENQQVESTLLSQYPWLFPQALQRTAGKMSLNGLRYGENLFALLDDPLQFSPTTYNPSNGSYGDSFENNRNWWQQFLYARDQKDPVTGLYLPGTASSRPFRPLSHYDSEPSTNSLNSLDDTLLRGLPLDQQNLPTALDKRGLFEARAQGDLASQGSAGNTIDYYTRQRLLAKIAGNTTARSNVFMVWVTVGFFEAYEAVPAVSTPNGSTTAVMQIGAETELTRHRGFFVVDRSVLEDAWVPAQYQQNSDGSLKLDANNNPILTPGTGIYDFQKFVKYRKTIQ